jgi:hypothetical protein
MSYEFFTWILTEWPIIRLFSKNNVSRLSCPIDSKARPCLGSQPGTIAFVSPSSDAHVYQATSSRHARVTYLPSFSLQKAWTFSPLSPPSPLPLLHFPVHCAQRALSEGVHIHICLVILFHDGSGVKGPGSKLEQESKIFFQELLRMTATSREC